MRRVIFVRNPNSLANKQIPPPVIIFNGHLTTKNANVDTFCQYAGDGKFPKIFRFWCSMTLFRLVIFKARSSYDEVSRNAHNGETNAKKLITRPIMTVTSPNSPHIALTYTKMRFDNFFDHSYPPSWSKLPKCIESGVVFLSGQKSNQNSRISTAKFY